MFATWTSYVLAMYKTIWTAQRSAPTYLVNTHSPSIFCLSPFSSWGEGLMHIYSLLVYTPKMYSSNINPSMKFSAFSVKSDNSTRKSQSVNHMDIWWWIYIRGVVKSLPFSNEQTMGAMKIKETQGSSSDTNLEIASHVNHLISLSISYKNAPNR